MSGNRVLLSFSSGKDCSWALHVLRTSPEYSSYEVVGLLTTFNESNGRVAMHGTRLELVQQQAALLGLPLWQVDLPSPCSNEEYAVRMAVLFQAARARSITHIAYGDLWLADVRSYRESTHQGTGITPLFPIWQGGGTEASCRQRSRELAERMLAAGVRAHLVTVDTKALPRELCGRAFDAALLADLEAAGADCCGEKGEFHTVACAGPAFSSALPAQLAPDSTLVERGQFVYSDFCLPAGVQALPLLPGGLLLDAAAIAAARTELQPEGWQRAAALGEALCPSAPAPSVKETQ